MLKVIKSFLLIILLGLMPGSQLFANGYDECPVSILWTPDSKWVVFDDGSNVYKIENSYLKELDAELKQQISDLIKQLGDAEWNEREKATEELVNIGKALLPVLDQVDAKDAEIKMRLKHIKNAIGSGKQNWKLLVSDGIEPDLAPDGKTIVCHTGTQLVVAGIVGENQKVIAEGEFHLPRWVDNGKKIIFGRGERFYGMDLYIIDAGGKNQKQITNTKASELNAHCSPDGEKLIYQYQAGPGLGKADYEILFLLGLRKLSSKQLFSYESGNKHYAHSRWFKNSKEIYYQYGGWGEWDIYRLRLDQSDILEKQAIKVISDGYHAHLSPDEKKIIFARRKNAKGNTPRREMDADIWLADSDGKNEKKLTNSEKHEISPAFSPDGKFVAYRMLNGPDSNRIESIDIIRIEDR